MAAYINTSLKYHFKSLNPDKIYICEAWIKGDNIQAIEPKKHNIGANVS